MERKRLSDGTLVAITLMIAESKPEEKRCDGKTGNESVEIIVALHRFYITTVYDEMKQPCAQCARSWHSHYPILYTIKINR